MTTLLGNGFGLRGLAMAFLGSAIFLVVGCAADAEDDADDANSAFSFPWTDKEQEAKEDQRDRLKALYAVVVAPNRKQLSDTTPAAVKTYLEGVFRWAVKDFSREDAASNNPATSIGVLTPKKGSQGYVVTASDSAGTDWYFFDAVVAKSGGEQTPKYVGYCTADDRFGGGCVAALDGARVPQTLKAK